MKFLVPALLLGTISTAKARRGDLCEAEKQHCDIKCDGNYEWRCQESPDGLKIEDQRCRCSKPDDESIVCREAMAQCDIMCAGKYGFQCIVLHDQIKSRICYCAVSAKAEQCTMRERQCASKVCEVASMVPQFECDDDGKTVEAKCTCDGCKINASAMVITLVAFVVFNFNERS